MEKENDYFHEVSYIRETVNRIRKKEQFRSGKSIRGKGKWRLLLGKPKSKEKAFLIV
jgi:hypothetical protein